MKRALLLLLLSGCAAQMMQTSGSRYAPVNERPGGRVRYLAMGIAPVQQARREDAYRQMYDACSGRYRIVSEYSDGSVTASSGQASAYGNSAYGSGVSSTGSWRYIDFECVQAAPKQYESSWKTEDEMAAESNQ